MSPTSECPHSGSPIREHSAPDAEETSSPWTSGRFTIGAHVVPEPGDPVARLDLAASVRAAGGDFVFVAEGPTAQARHTTSSQAVDLAGSISRDVGLPAAAGVLTWHRTIMALQAQVLGAHARGVTTLVCQTGLPPLAGERAVVDGRWNVDAAGLIALLAALNDGCDHLGLEVPDGLRFEIGARINPAAPDLGDERERMKRKVEAGAQFLVTRPVFDLRGLDVLLEALDGEIPVFVTLRHVQTLDEALHLSEELPGATVPDAVLRRLRHAGASASTESWTILQELADQARHVGRGLVLASRPAAWAALVKMIEAQAVR